MKKIILLVLISFLFPIIVAADHVTYYSEYNYIDESEVENIDENLIKRYEKNILKHYKINYLDYGYNHHLGEGYIVDMNDYIFTDFSEYLDSYPNLEYGDYQVYHDNFYKVKRLKPIEYIVLSNISGSYMALRFLEIEVFQNGMEVDYELTCTSCSDYFYANVSDGNYNNILNVAYNNSEIVIRLDDYVYIDDLELYIYLYDALDTEKAFDISFKRNLDEASLVYYHFRETFKNDSNNNVFKFSLDNEFLILNDAKYEDYFITQFNDYKFPNFVEHFYKYRYRYYLYKNYKENIVECDILFEDCDFSSEEVKTKHKYKDKLTLLKPIIIEEYQDVENFIIESSSEVRYEVKDDYIFFQAGLVNEKVPYQLKSFKEEKVIVPETTTVYKSENNNVLDVKEEEKFEQVIILEELKEEKEEEEVFRRSNVFLLMIVFLLLFLVKKVNDYIHWLLQGDMYS